MYALLNLLISGNINEQNREKKDMKIRIKPINKVKTSDGKKTLE